MAKIKKIAYVSGFDGTIYYLNSETPNYWGGLQKSRQFGALGSLLSNSLESDSGKKAEDFEPVVIPSFKEKILETFGSKLSASKISLVKMESTATIDTLKSDLEAAKKLGATHLIRLIPSQNQELLSLPYGISGLLLTRSHAIHYDKDDNVELGATAIITVELYNLADNEQMKSSEYFKEQHIKFPVKSKFSELDPKASSTAVEVLTKNLGNLTTEVLSSWNLVK
jgi:hypothetical protein